MSSETPPIERFYDLSDLSEAGDEVRITAAADELPALASWFEIEAVERFEATITLTRKGKSHFLYEAALTADLVQSCVVSLEPVKSHHALGFSRDLRVRPRHPRHRASDDEQGGILTLAAGEDEVPEELDSSHFDLAGPLLEELSLDIDQYPRAEGVEFEIPEDKMPKEEGPFAALKRLKQGDG